MWQVPGPAHSSVGSVDCGGFPAYVWSHSFQPVQLLKGMLLWCWISCSCFCLNCPLKWIFPCNVVNEHWILLIFPKHFRVHEHECAALWLLLHFYMCSFSCTWTWVRSLWLWHHSCMCLLCVNGVYNFWIATTLCVYVDPSLCIEWGGLLCYENCLAVLISVGWSKDPSDAVMSVLGPPRPVYKDPSNLFPWVGLCRQVSLRHIGR